MYRFSLFIALMTIVISSMCPASEISIEGLIRGVNQARQTIQSGEILTITTTEFADRKSEEEIALWIQAEKEQRLRNFTPDPLFPDIDAKHFERNYLIPVLNIEANRERQRINEEHTTTVFQIMDSNTSGFPISHHYKLTMVEEPGYSLDSEETQLFLPVRLSLLAYDTKTQVKEGLGDILISSPSKESIIISDIENAYGYWHYSLFGRSPFQVPVNAQRVGKGHLNGIECHILAFTNENGQRIKIWVDVEKDFCVRNIEYQRNLPTEHISARTVYKHFYNFGDVWFPKIMEQTFYETDGTIQYTTKIQTTAAEFNVEVPLNFFDINPDYYRALVPELPGMGLLPNTDNGLITEHAEVLRDLILLCGPKSLLRICELLKVKTNLREIKKLSGFDQNRGTTMLGLKKAAAYKNLAPKGVKASVELLRRNKVPLPAIAYVNNNHFLVFEAVDKEGVKISDPAQKYSPHRTWNKLSEIWSGELLIFNKTKRREGQKQTPLAFTEASEYDFGKVLGGSKIKHTFTIKNIGQRPLRILTVQETCDCTASVLSQDKILPGKTGDIVAVLTVPSENRRVQESLKVFTDDPVQNTLTLTLKGEAFIPLNPFPKRIDFGNQKTSKQNLLTKQMSLHVQEGVQIRSVRTDSKQLTATMKTKNGIPYVEVQFLPSLVGHFANNILIDYTYQEKQATHKVLASGQVLGEFNVTPNRLFFGLIKDPSAVSKTITISSRNTQPFKIISVVSNVKAIAATLKKGEGEIQYQIMTTLEPKADPGELSGEIVIHTSSSIQPTLRVPFFGILPDDK